MVHFVSVQMGCTSRKEIIADLHDFHTPVIAISQLFLFCVCGVGAF